MQTYLDCMPCFLKQTLYTARLSSSSKKVHKEIMSQVAALLSQLDFDKTPPENSMPIYGLIASISGCTDPFAALKKESNRLALELADEIRRTIRQSSSPLLTAIKFSIAGNIIDYGAHHDFDIQATIKQCLVRQLAINDYDKLVKDLKKTKTILYLGDNSGEIVFDTLVIEQLENPVVFAVKEKPIINDAMREDALACGMDKLCEIISNGTNCPGTPLSRCSEQFQKSFEQADLIISKGQGNFETLSEVRAPIYFLLTVKCPVVSRHIMDLSGEKKGPSEVLAPILLKSPNFKNRSSA